jgi:hypothetical protein
MAKKEKRAIDQLNVALAGVDSVLAVLQSKATGMDAELLKKAREYVEEAQDHTLTIQFHLAQL